MWLPYLGLILNSLSKWQILGRFAFWFRLFLNVCLSGLLSYHLFLSDAIFNVLLVQLIDLVNSQQQLCLHLSWVRNVVKIRANRLPLYNRITASLPSQQGGLLWRAFAAGGEACLLRYLFLFEVQRRFSGPCAVKIVQSFIHYFSLYKYDVGNPSCGQGRQRKLWSF